MSTPEVLNHWVQYLAQSRLKDDVKGFHIVVAVFVIAVLSIISSQLTSMKQRYVPGVPIVGGDDKASIKKNRLRFVNDSMNMLKEGYEAVSIIVTMLFS